MSRDPAQGLVPGCEVTPRAYFVHRSAEDAVLCRGVGCPREPSLYRGVQRTQSFAGEWGVPTKLSLNDSPLQAASQAGSEKHTI